LGLNTKHRVVLSTGEPAQEMTYGPTGKVVAGRQGFAPSVTSP